MYRKHNSQRGAHLLSSKGCFAVRLEQTPRFSLLRLLIIRGLLSKHSFKKAGTEDGLHTFVSGKDTSTKLAFSVKEFCGAVLNYLTEEHEHAHVNLQQASDTKCSSLVGAQGVE